MSPAPPEALAEFAQALLAPGAPVPAGLVGGGGPAALAARYAIHRNNVVAGLVAALRARCSVTERLVGGDCFAALARAHVLAEPPRSPLMHRYGESFPAWLAAHGPIDEVPYLADVAALESACAEAFHAAEAVPLAAEDLAAMEPDALARATLRLHPSARLVESRWPVLSIWRAHRPDAELRAPARWDGESVLVHRPHDEVLLHALSPGALAFCRALVDGADVADAAEAALGAESGLDVGRCLVGLAAAGAVAAVAATATDLA